MTEKRKYKVFTKEDALDNLLGKELNDLELTRLVREYDLFNVGCIKKTLYEGEYLYYRYGINPLSGGLLEVPVKPRNRVRRCITKSNKPVIKYYEEYPKGVENYCYFETKEYIKDGINYTKFIKSVSFVKHNTTELNLLENAVQS